MLGLINNDYELMTRETFQNYVNLGGIDYIGRGPDEIRTEAQKAKVAETCRKLGLNGLVLVGATSTMTDTVHLSEYFLANQVQTSVITIPGTVDGNVHHSYI